MSGKPKTDAQKAAAREYETVRRMSPEQRKAWTEENFDRIMLVARIEWRKKWRSGEYRHIEHEDYDSGFEIYGDGEDQISFDSAMYRD